MGYGLGIKPEGTYVAFTAGTGILPFLDIVAHLILLKRDCPLVSDTHRADLSKFKFILHGSFMNE